MEERLLRVIAIQREIVATALDIDAVMEVVVQQVPLLTRGDAAVVEFVESDEIVYRATSGTAAGLEGLRLRLDSSLSGRCVLERRVLRSDDTAKDERVDQAAARAVGAVSMLCVPLAHRDEDVIGVLKVYAGRPSMFDDDDATILGHLSGVVASHLRHAAEFERKEHESRHDMLTDLANRRAYEERLSREIARSDRYGLPLSLVVFDLDGFKAINDSRGHPAGDEALRRVAGLLRELRTADECFRVGGDEFALLLAGTGGDGAQRVAERVAERIATARIADGGLTASCGVAEHVPGTAELHRRADEALMESKRARDRA